MAFVVAAALLLFRVLVAAPGFVAGPFVALEGRAPFRGHVQYLRGDQDHPRGQHAAGGAGAGFPGRLHRHQLVEQAVLGAFIVVQRHGGALPYLSLASGTSVLPATLCCGPSTPGLRSKSKMSVGSHNVAQALGTSTTQLMWPCTGAQPSSE